MNRRLRHERGVRLRQGSGETPPKLEEHRRGTEKSQRSFGTAERLQKILSAAGVASRVLSESLIAQRRVSVNGGVITELGTKAGPRRDDIRVDGRRIRIEPRRRYILLNKPRGYVTTRRDPQGRPTVLDLLEG